MSWLGGILRDLREGKRPRLRLAVYLALYIAIIAAIVTGMDAAVAISGADWTKYIVLIAGLVATWFVANWKIGPSQDEPDPFARNTLTAIRHEIRGWYETGRPMTWERARSEDLPAHVRGAFEKLEQSPEVRATSGGWAWAAAERDWHGYPDPPRFVVLGFDASGRLGAAIDVNTWPTVWEKPADWPIEPAPKTPAP